MKPLHGLLAIFALTLALLPQVGSAQDTFENEADWLASLCDDAAVVEEEFDVDVPDNSFGTPVENPFETAFGTLTGVAGAENNGLSIGSDEGLAIDSTGFLLEFNDGQGEINGFGTVYTGEELAITINFADGSTEVVTAPGFDDFITPGFFGWTNTSGQDVTSIELTPTSANFILGVDFAFVESLCPEEEEEVIAEGEEEQTPVLSCEDQLDVIITDLIDALPSGNESDDWKIYVAAYKLSILQHPAIWIDNDRLTTDYGCFFFAKAKTAIAFLEATSSFDSTESVAAINTLLRCVVDVEIQDAIDEGGDPVWIAAADYYRECADYLEDAGENTFAAYLRKLAWYYARCS